MKQAASDIDHAWTKACIRPIDQRPLPSGYADQNQNGSRWFCPDMMVVSACGRVLARWVIRWWVNGGLSLLQRTWPT
jgi:hypothetical protein